MANDSIPDHTDWWLLWLFSTIVLPAASLWLCVKMKSFNSLYLLVPLGLWLMVESSKRATSSKNEIVPSLLIVGGLLMQLFSGYWGCANTFKL